jgi:hypothetical protein
MHAHGLQHLSRSRVFLRATPLHAEKYARVICLQALPLAAMRVLISTESRDTSAHAMWIWLETDDQLNRYACFFTPSTNQMPSSSQHVDANVSYLSARARISATYTGICYYYCIYINRNIYIVSISKGDSRRQTVQEHWSGIGCGMSNARVCVPTLALVGSRAL